MAGALCEREQEFLQRVVDFYQSRTVTKMNIAMERLALIDALVLPVTAVAGIYGMNIIVPARTNYVHLTAVLALITTISLSMLVWAGATGGGKPSAPRSGAGCGSILGVDSAILVLGARSSVDRADGFYPSGRGFESFRARV